MKIIIVAVIILTINAFRVVRLSSKHFLLKKKSSTKSSTNGNSPENSIPAMDSENLALMTAVDSENPLMNPTLGATKLYESIKPQDPIQKFVTSILSHKNIPKKPHKNFLGTKSLDFNIRPIINSPKVTMASKLIGFDIDATIEMVKSNAQINFDFRKKNVIAVVRGMGGGKTRALTEIRNAGMKTDGTLSIAITYNCGMRLLPDEIKQSNHPSVNLILTVVTRILSVVYDVDIDDVIKAIDIKYLLAQDEIMAIQILREFLMYVVSDVRKYREVHTLILSVDEASRVVEEIENVNSVKGDISGCLRKALLDPFEKQYDFEVALILSCLNLQPIGLTYSGQGRGVTPLLLPGRLDVKKIVNDWWNCSGKSAEERDRLLLVANGMNNLPRLVEYTGHFIAENILRKLDRTFMLNLTVTIQETLSRIYVLDFFPSPQLLHKIIFSTPTPLDSELLECIKRSVITNSIEDFCETYTILPESSIFTLGTAALNDKTEHSKIIAAAYEEISKTFIGIPDGGFLLEKYFLIWLKVRLSVSIHNRDIRLSLGSLLGFPSNFTYKGFPASLTILLNETISNLVQYDIDNRYGKPFRISTYIDSIGFMKELTSLPLYRFRASVGGDKFDGFFKHRSVAFMEDIPIFWDVKSRISKTARRRPPVQYYQMKKLMNGKRFLFVYFTTFNGVCKVMSDDCIIVNRDIAASFFGPIWGLFQYFRSSLDS